MLELGIPEEEDIKFFEEEELKLLTSFELGMVCMHAGLPKVIPRQSPKRWSETDFRTRLKEAYSLVNADFPPLMTISLVRKMNAHGWFCNVSWRTVKSWEVHAGKVLYDRMKRLLK